MISPIYSSLKKIIWFQQLKKNLSSILFIYVHCNLNINFVLYKKITKDILENQFSLKSNDSWLYTATK